LKGLLHELGKSFPKTHVLENLLDLLLPDDPTLRPLLPDAVRLTRYAVEYRYPGIRATKPRAQSALAAAERIRAEVRRRLGLRP
jgi:HEPN domain-containing protein